MKIINTYFDGVYIIENSLYKDNRGEFQKLYQNSLFQKKNIDIKINEHFFSKSKKGVIRGMHFQIPPNAQSKLVYVLFGKVLDVIIDLRTDSKTYKKSMQVELNSEDRKAIFIPEGFAHGFQCLDENTVMVYSQSGEFDSKSDSGISPFSFKMNWPIEDYIVSNKDRELISLLDFKSPFK